MTADDDDATLREAIGVAVEAFAPEREPLRRRLESTLFGPAAGPSEDRRGRYVVIEEAGAGGMGVVLRAYDPKLRREVALKKLRVGHDVREQSPLLREARAMARLSHPNVLAVFDVEDIDAQTYLVMEYVEGTTLRTWLDEARRPWAETLELFLQAARGLQAAHAAGVVHRDFKPSNVLVGSDARARVMDFGLASGADEVAPSEDGSPSTRAGADERFRGVVAGTPAYMAPEQHRGAVADARADQYAWCVALFEGLFGRRPFEATQSSGLAAAKTAGPPALPRRPVVPRWLGRVLTRGLSVEPDDRWGSMSELLAAVDRGRRRTTTVRAVAAAVVVLGVTGALEGSRRVDRAARDRACTEAADAIASTWPGRDGELAARTRTALTAPIRERFDARVESFVDAWREARRSSCVMHSVESAWNDDLGARADECLAEGRGVLEALLVNVARGDVATSRRAVQAVARLPRPEPCADPVALARRSPAGPAIEELGDTHDALWRAHGAVLAGRADEAVVLAREAARLAEATGWGPVRAEAQVMVGRALSKSGDFAAAEPALTEGYLAASAEGAFATSLAAATQLVHVVGIRRGRLDEGLLWGRLAEVDVIRLDASEEVEGAAWSMNVASVHHTAGRYARARELYERALAIFQARLGTDHPDTALLYTALGNVDSVEGDPARAESDHRRALTVLETSLGPDHPDVARTLHNLANTRLVQGAAADAEALFTRALAISERTHGPDHADVALAWYGLGRVAATRGDTTKAIDASTTALEVAERAFGPEHPDVARYLDNVGVLYVTLGDPARALPMHERAQTTFEAAVGREHPENAVFLENLAGVQLALGRPAEAQASSMRALTLRAAVPTPDPAAIAKNAVELSRAAFALARATP